MLYDKTKFEYDGKPLIIDVPLAYYTDLVIKEATFDSLAIEYQRAVDTNKSLADQILHLQEQLDPEAGDEDETL